MTTRRKIPISLLRGLCEAAGYSPDDIACITANAYTVTFIEYQRDETGQRFLSRDGVVASRVHKLNWSA